MAVIDVFIMQLGKEPRGPFRAQITSSRVTWSRDVAIQIHDHDPIISEQDPVVYRLPDNQYHNFA